MGAIHFFKIICLSGFTLIILFALVGLAIADVRISGFTDLNLGSWAGMGDLTDEMNLCVYNSDSLEPNYNITASGGGSFVLESGANQVAYVPAFKGSVGAYQDLTHGVAATFSEANHASDDCGGGTNANLRITVTEAALSAARAGSYSGVITVLLEPEP